MQNVKTNITGTKLIIEIDLSQDFGPSKSGKTTSIASTLGNVEVQKGVFLGVNVYKKR